MWASHPKPWNSRLKVLDVSGDFGVRDLRVEGYLVQLVWLLLTIALPENNSTGRHTHTHTYAPAYIYIDI